MAGDACQGEQESSRGRFFSLLPSAWSSGAGAGASLLLSGHPIRANRPVEGPFLTIVTRKVLLPTLDDQGVDLRRLRYFIAVAEQLSFSRAAGRVGLSQQALSSQIRRLEQEIGCVLFFRTTRRVELSPAGRALLPKARLSLAAAVEALANARAAQPEPGHSRSVPRQGGGAFSGRLSAARSASAPSSRGLPGRSSGRRRDGR